MSRMEIHFYKAPSASVYEVRTEGCVCFSNANSSAALGGWNSSAGDAWNGSSGSGSGSDLGGWTDNGGSAWD